MLFLFLSGHLTRKFTETKISLKIIFITCELVNKVNLCRCPFMRLPRTIASLLTYMPSDSITHLLPWHRIYSALLPLQRKHEWIKWACKDNKNNINMLTPWTNSTKLPMACTQHPPGRKYQNKFVKNQRHKSHSKIIICNPDMSTIGRNASTAYQNQLWDPA